MQCRIADMRYKEVINVSNGHRLGFVCDAEINIVTGQTVSIIVPGPCRFFGLFGREDDYIIPWECIQRIGDDLILIDIIGDQVREKREKRGWFL